MNCLSQPTTRGVLKKTRKQEIKHRMQDTIISLNVGGIIYRVRRNLLLQSPNTLLGMAAADMNDTDDEASIIIQRDGCRFQYVLDWMQTTSDEWDLPTSVDREAFYTDMECYGFCVDTQ
jgi:BTB/POZ domain